MEDWDQATLEKVVESKKNEFNQNKQTDIVRFIVDSLGLICLIICLYFFHCSFWFLIIAGFFWMFHDIALFSNCV